MPGIPALPWEPCSFSPLNMSKREPPRVVSHAFYWIEPTPTINLRLITASFNSLPSNSATSEAETVVKHGFSASGSSSVHRSTGVSMTVSLSKSCVVDAFGDVVVLAPAAGSNVRFV